ncbi:MAG: choice-of-anchor Q domain-containing protein, partial [Planctomycetota bacterium]
GFEIDGEHNFLGQDPLLGPRTFDGSSFTPLVPQPGSPAIDAGDPYFDPNDPDGDPSTDDAVEFDHRGAPYARVAGGRLDLGAFERQQAGGSQRADFDESGKTDGGDLLVWQRGFGVAHDARPIDGDATGDGDVDQRDLEVWEATFGDAASLGEAATARSSQATAASVPAIRVDGAASLGRTGRPLFAPAPRSGLELAERVSPPTVAEPPGAASLVEHAAHEETSRQIAEQRGADRSLIAAAGSDVADENFEALEAALWEFALERAWR